MHISIIGTGNMGSAVAIGLLSAGHEVTVYNRTRARAERLASRGARVVETAADAVSAAPYIMVLLADGASANEVLLSAAVRPVLRNKALMSAVAMDVDEFTVLSNGIAAEGGRMSDGNIMSYPDAVERQQAEFIMAACPEDAAAWRRILQDLGPLVHDAGTAGNASRAQTAFLFANMFVRVAVAYSLAAFEKQGLPVYLLQHTLSANPATALPYADQIVEGMLRRDYSGDDWSVDMTIRSIDQAIELARKLGIETGVMSEIRKMYARTSELGLGRSVANALYESINPRTGE